MRGRTVSLPAASLMALALLGSAPALAAPGLLPLHGNLTDAEGVPLEGDTSLSFTLYGDDARTDVLWSSTQTVALSSGNFTTQLGAATPLDLELFAGTDTVYLGVAVGGDAEMELVRLGTVPFAAFADWAGEAELATVAEMADVADDALALGGTPAAEVIGSIPDQATVEGWATAVTYDTVDELTADLDAVYQLTAGNGLQLVSNELRVVEADLRSLLDDDYVLTAGDGIAIAGGAISVVESDLLDLLDDDYGLSAGDGLTLDTATRELSVDARALTADLDDDYGFTFGEGLEVDSGTLEVSVVEEDLTDLLDDGYLDIEYQPAWSDLTGVPTGLADGDDDTTYTAGAGLALSGTTFSVVRATIESYAEGVAYDSVAELRADLDSVYQEKGAKPELSSSPCTTVTSTVSSNGFVERSASCPSGSYVTGGGCSGNDGDGSTRTLFNHPSGNGWRCRFYDNDGNNETFTAYAICCF